MMGAVGGGILLHARDKGDRVSRVWLVGKAHPGSLGLGHQHRDWSDAKVDRQILTLMIDSSGFCLYMLDWLISSSDEQSEPQVQS